MAGKERPPHPTSPNLASGLANDKARPHLRESGSLSEQRKKKEREAGLRPPSAYALSQAVLPGGRLPDAPPRKRSRFPAPAANLARIPLYGLLTTFARRSRSRNHQTAARMLRAKGYPAHRFRRGILPSGRVGFFRTEGQPTHGGAAFLIPGRPRRSTSRAPFHQTPNRPDIS